MVDLVGIDIQAQYIIETTDVIKRINEQMINWIIQYISFVYGSVVGFHSMLY